jgi:hypothetical protein
MDSSDDVKNGERLARVEQDVVTVKDFLVRIDSKLDAWQNTYVPRQEINEMFRARDKEITELKDNKKHNSTQFVAWAAVIVALVSIVLPYIHK